MEEVMGFGGFGKKARTFDFQAIFEETRRNAQARNQRAKENNDTGTVSYFNRLINCFVAYLLSILLTGLLVATCIGPIVF